MKISSTITKWSILVIFINNFINQGHNSEFISKNVRKYVSDIYIILRLLKVDLSEDENIFCSLFYDKLGV